MQESYFQKHIFYKKLCAFRFRDLENVKKKNPSTLITKNDEVSAPEQSIHQSFVSTSSP